MRISDWSSDVCSSDLNANIGAARAAFFPTISLTGTLGTLSTALSGLFKDGSYTYTGSPGASLPLFDFGRRSGTLEYARASQISDERRVGKECHSTCRYRWYPAHNTKHIHPY